MNHRHRSSLYSGFAVFTAVLLSTGPLVGQALRIEGRALDHDSGEPVANVTVSIVNNALEVVDSTTTDGQGRYDLAVPSAGLYAVRGSAVNFVSQMSLPFELTTSASGTALRMSAGAVLLDPFEISRPNPDGPEARTDRTSVEVGESDAPGRSGTVRGTIVELESGNPVAQARVELLDEGGGVVSTATSNASGAYLLRTSAEGPLTLRGSRLGYATRTTESFSLGAGRWAVVDLPMATEAVRLDPIEVAVESDAIDPLTDLLMGEFFERRRVYGALGTGKFADRTDLEPLDSTPFAVALMSLGMNVVQADPAGNIPVLREKGGRLCLPTIFINGTVARGWSEDAGIVLSVRRIEAVEVYRSAEMVPGELQVNFPSGNRPCGVISIWTRRN